MTALADGVDGQASAVTGAGQPSASGFGDGQREGIAASGDGAMPSNSASVGIGHLVVRIELNGRDRDAEKRLSQSRRWPETSESSEVHPGMRTTVRAIERTRSRTRRPSLPLMTVARPSLRTAVISPT